MPAHVSIGPLPSVPTYVVGSTPQDTFAIPFPFFVQGDILVYIDDVLLSPADYAVSGSYIEDGEAIVGAFGSGQVVLDTPVSNTTVTVDRFIDPARETDFPAQGPLQINQVNTDLDKLTARDQDMLRLERRAQHTPASEPDAPPIPEQEDRAGTIRAWTDDGSEERTDLLVSTFLAYGVAIAALWAAVQALQSQVAYLLGKVAQILALLSHLATGGSLSGVDLGNYLPASAALSNADLALYPNVSTWTNVSEQLRQAFLAAGAIGLPVNGSGLRGCYYIDPATAILILQGTGFVGPDQQPCQLTYFTDSFGVLKQQIGNPGLTFVVDCRSAHKNTPWFARQGGTRISNLQVAGFGLLEDAAMADVSGYPTMVYTGTSTPWSPTDHAPIIVTDHRHDQFGNVVAQAKAGNTYLDAHIVGVMQAAYVGDALLAEEPWCASVSSGNVTGLSLTEVNLTGFALKRMLGASRCTAGGVGLVVRIKDNPVFWTAITQPLSGGLTNYALLKWKSFNCHCLELWHRAVGIDIEVNCRNARYGVLMQAGYSPDGPTYAAPTINSAVAVGAVISGTDGNVFRATVAGNYTIQPVASGVNYNAATKIFTDTGSALRWEFICARQDTGKYNAGRIKITGERIITHLRCEANAYMHQIRIEPGGHSMDFYNTNEMGSSYEIRTDGRIAGAIDKAVYDLGVLNKDYGINDKVSDGSGNVFSCTVAGTLTVVPTPSGGNYNTATKMFTDPGSTLVWVFRNGGFKAMGDQPFAVVDYTGGLQESPRRVFSGNVYDGHLYHRFDGFKASIWAQPKTAHADAALYNPSPSTVLIVLNSTFNASGNSKRVFDVAAPQNLVVGNCQFFGQIIPLDANNMPTGVFPTAVGGNLLDSFWAGKNCLAFSAGTAQGDDDDGGGNDG